MVLWWFAIAAICCNVVTLWLLVSWSSARRGILGLVAPLRRHAIGASAVVATVATIGSLYLSEVAHFVPCHYCWLQRIAMYPLALVLLIAWFTRDTRVRRYAVPMAVIGLMLSTWHYLLQRFPTLEGGGSCDVANPCSLTLTWKFHFVSIPYMAGSAFVLVAVLLLSTWRNQKTQIRL